MYGWQKLSGKKNNSLQLIGGWTYDEISGQQRTQWDEVDRRHLAEYDL